MSISAHVLIVLLLLAGTPDPPKCLYTESMRRLDTLEIEICLIGQNDGRAKRVTEMRQRIRNVSEKHVSVIFREGLGFQPFTMFAGSEMLTAVSGQGHHSESREPLYTWETVSLKPGASTERSFKLTQFSSRRLSKNEPVTITITGDVDYYLPGEDPEPSATYNRRMLEQRASGQRTPKLIFRNVLLRETNPGGSAKTGRAKTGHPTDSASPTERQGGARPDTQGKTGHPTIPLSRLKDMGIQFAAVLCCGRRSEVPVMCRGPNIVLGSGAKPAGRIGLSLRRGVG